MRTTTVGDVKILLPDLDRDDLDSVTDLAEGLTEALVEGVSWRGVQIEDSSIRSSRITGGDLGESTWEAGSIYGCEITRTDFSGATLAGITIERCAITGSRFTGTRLTDVRLKDVLFDGCRFDYVTFQRVTAAGSVAFADCIFTNGTWSSCRLPGIALRSCDLAGLELDTCHLDRADLRGSRLHGLKAPLENLHGVNLAEAQLPELTQLAVDAPASLCGGTDSEGAPWPLMPSPPAARARFSSAFGTRHRALAVVSVVGLGGGEAVMMRYGSRRARCRSESCCRRSRSRQWTDCAQSTMRR